jgi:hypothetical protein
MTNFKSLLFCLFVSSNLGSCRPEGVVAELPSTSSIHPDPSIIGSWTYSFPFYSMELVIKENGFFQYYAQGCVNKSYSEGFWTIHNGNLELSSFDQFKNQSVLKDDLIEDSIVSTDAIREAGTVVNEKIEDVFILDLLRFKTSLLVDWPDTSRIYFDKISYRLVGDTLYQLDSRGIVSDIRLHQKPTIR